MPGWSFLVPFAPFVKVRALSVFEYVTKVGLQTTRSAQVENAQGKVGTVTHPHEMLRVGWYSLPSRTAPQNSQFHHDLLQSALPLVMLAQFRALRGQVVLLQFLLYRTVLMILVSSLESGAAMDFQTAVVFVLIAALTFPLALRQLTRVRR